MAVAAAGTAVLTVEGEIVCSSPSFLFPRCLGCISSCEHSPNATHYSARIMLAANVTSSLDF